MIRIIPYTPKHQPHFESLNRAWIEKDFTFEPVDAYVLQHPQEAIIDNGGAILLAEDDGIIAGTVALKQHASNVYEFTKMAVDPQHQRKGIAALLTREAIKLADEMNAEKLILYSNRKLLPALKLYEKAGFREIPIEPGIYERADIKMEYRFNKNA